MWFSGINLPARASARRRRRVAGGLSLPQRRVAERDEKRTVANRGVVDWAPATRMCILRLHVFRKTCAERNVMIADQPMFFVVLFTHK